MNNSWAYLPQKRLQKSSVSAGISKKLNQAELSSLGKRLRNAVDMIGSAKKTGSFHNAGRKSSDLTFHRNKLNGTPVFMDQSAVSKLSRYAGKYLSGASSQEIALQFINANNDIFRLEKPLDELQLISETKSSDEKKHIMFAQMYRGVPVWGNRVVVHLESSGRPYAVNGRYSPTPAGLDVNDIRVNENNAVDKAIKDLLTVTEIRELDDFIKTICSYDGPSAEIVILPETESRLGILAWHVFIRPNLKDQWNYFIDVKTGDIIEKYNDTDYQSPITAAARDALGEERTFMVAEHEEMFYMADLEAAIYTYDAKGEVINRDSQVSIVSSLDNTWADSIAVSAHSNARVVFDYYLENHNRRGLDGKSIDLPVVIHYSVDGSTLNNAFWSGRYIAFGDALPFAAALDVVAHELTHGVVEYTVGLEYKFQSGALNEAFADAMAAVVDPNWIMGEDIINGGMRDLENPGLYGLPAHMDDYRNMSLNNDYGGVHINMSIPSHAFFLTAQEIGREEAARIWYTILDRRYLTPKSQFIDMRLAAIQSATDLFGNESAEVSAVKNAFDEVGIIDDKPSEIPEDILPAEGEQFIAFVYESENQNLLALVNTDSSGEGDLIFPTRNEVFTNGSCPISVSKDGSILFFVDSANNLRMIRLDTNEEIMLDNSGNWGSISLAPDGSKLAATSYFADKTIYVF
ncbi:MAG: peptidase M4 family protein, partial [Candidatus Latescibacteria bacterium]|nr:peptidase M4 family protein [Candidatus Latescibacterota bacterium]